MVKQFKPLREIVSENMAFGDLIMLRKICNFIGVYTHRYDTPVFYGGIDNYISDGKAGVRKGRQFKGIRIFNKRRNKHFEADNNDTIFYHPKKGLLIPFNYEHRYEYSLLLKSSDLPKQ